MHAIDTILNDFSRFFNKAANNKKTEAIISIIDSSIKENKLDELNIVEAQNCIRTNRKASKELIKELESLRDSYDDDYFRLYSIKEEHTELSLEFFKKARAVAAIVYALEAKSDTERSDCIYEAIHSFDQEPAQILERICRLL